MFGSIFNMKPRRGQEANIAAHFRRWERERRPAVAGAVGGFVFRPRNVAGELIGVTVFDSEDSYRVNANDPAQNEWYGELRQMLETDPEWNDGDILVAI
jgi:hypothetical protein